MSKKYTTDTFKEELNKIHGNKYDYSDVVYTGSSQKIKVSCKTHGPFFITANSHQQGRGCIKCGYDSSKLKQVMSTEDFIYKAKKILPDVDFRLVNYVNMHTKIDLICSEHGLFSIEPTNLFQGKGCKCCANKDSSIKQRKSLEDFIKDCNTKHEDTYSYDSVEYLGSNIDVNIFCKSCNKHFKQKPYNHLLGNGCPDCADYGFNIQSPANFYVLMYDNIVKVGITNREVELRVKEISKSSNKNFSILLHEHFDTGLKARNLEKLCLVWLRHNFDNVGETFDGYTECFKDVDVNKLKEIINKTTKGM